jgi:hypothetical protein
MSISQSVTNAVRNVVQLYITQIADKYNLDQKDLLDMWDCEDVKITPKKVFKPTNTDSSLDHSELKKLNKAELVELCKARGVKCTGTKPVLVGYLTCSDPEITSKKTPAGKAKPIPSTPAVLKLMPKASDVPIRRNQFGNFEHPETSFIFNNKTSKVIGKQNDDGTVDDLTTEDINICNKYKFSFEIPENLDKKSGLNDVHVEELDEEESEEETEEELEDNDFDEFDEECSDEEEAYYEE